MANTSISNLSAGAAVAATDLIPNVQSIGVGPVKTTAAQLKTYMSASPTLVTPTLGVATATSINKVSFTAPATSATLTLADGKTITFSNTLTFTGTDSSSIAFGTGGTVAYLAAQTFTGAQTFPASGIKLTGSSTGVTTFASANAGATNYTFTVPAANDTAAVLGTAQTFSAAKTFTATPVVTVSPASAAAMNFSGCTLSVTTGSSTAIAAASGILIITDPDQTGATGVYVLGGGAAVKLGSSKANWEASTTTPTAGNFSIAFSGGVYRVYNAQGNNITFQLSLLMTRTDV